MLSYILEHLIQQLLFSDGMKLGGHCHLYDLCYVNGSKCNFTSHTCECRFGYEQTDDHTCSRIPGIIVVCFIKQISLVFRENA